MPDDPSSSTDPIPVELDLFSGRVNPRWWIAGESAAELRQLCARLSLAAQFPPTPAGLGYRGVVFEMGGQPARTWNGYVVIGRLGLADPERRAEQLLLGTLPAKYQALRQRLPRPQG